MKHYPLAALYLLVAVLGLVGLRDSTLQDRRAELLQVSVETETRRANTQLRAALQSLQKRLDAQTQAYEAQVAILRRQLDSSIADSDSLRQEVDTLRLDLDFELASHREELDGHTDRIASLLADVEQTRCEIEPLRHQLQNTDVRLATALQKECDAREQLATQYDNAFAKQSELLSILRTLADASQARAAAQQQIAEQAAVEAASLERLAQHTKLDASGVAATEDDAVVHVAQRVAVGHELSPTTSDAAAAPAETSTDTDAAQTLLNPPASP